MKINKDKKCVELWSQHWYKVSDDLYYPSVTSVLETLYKGYGYDTWLMSVSMNAKMIVQKAAESGSKIHDAIERFLLGEKLEPYGFEEEQWKKLCYFAEWFNELDIEVIATENELISNKFKLGGTCDAVFRIDGENYLIDFKTGNALHEINHLQTACYCKMWNDTHKIKVTRAGLLHVGANIKTKKGLNNKGIKFEETDLVKYGRLFEHTLNIYNEMYRKPVPVLSYPLELQKKGRQNV